MIAGDSISAGFLRPSYRLPLLNQLASLGCTVDMVGSETLSSFSFRNPTVFPGSYFPGFSPADGYDTDHQSWPGITAGEFATGASPSTVTVLPIATYVNNEQPDFVLIHLGTNDLSTGLSQGDFSNTALNNIANQTVSEVRTVIEDTINAHSNPANLRILVANLIPYSKDDLTVSETLAAMIGSYAITVKLEGMVSVLGNPNVFLVDTQGGFDTNTMTTDGVHPNATGENHLANRFLPALRDAGLCGNGVVSQPELTTPAPGSKLLDSIVRFNWVSNGTQALNWWVKVGSTPGGTEYADSQRITNGSTRGYRAEGLPTDGSTVYVEFSARTSAGWNIRDFEYTAAGSAGSAQTRLTSSCLAGNGRVDLNIVNTQSSNAVYRLELQGQSPRQRTVSPGDWARIAITGRPPGSYSAVVKRNGEIILNKDIVISCNAPTPSVSSPEVTVVNACRAGNGQIFFQITNPTAQSRGYVVEFSGVANRSTSAAGFGQALRGTTGRPDGTYNYAVRSGSTIVGSGSVTVDC